MSLRRLARRLHPASRWACRRSWRRRWCSPLGVLLGPWGTSVLTPGSSDRCRRPASPSASPSRCLASSRSGGRGWPPWWCGSGHPPGRRPHPVPTGPGAGGRGRRGGPADAAECVDWAACRPTSSGLVVCSACRWRAPPSDRPRPARRPRREPRTPFSARPLTVCGMATRPERRAPRTWTCRRSRSSGCSRTGQRHRHRHRARRGLPHLARTSKGSRWRTGSPHGDGVRPQIPSRQPLSVSDAARRRAPSDAVPAPMRPNSTSRRIASG